MGKLNIAFYWGASSGGCEVSLLDLNEKLLNLAEKVNIVLCPLVVDGKYHDVEKMADGELAVTFFNGAVRNSEAKHLAELLRRKSKLIVAYGVCAGWGGNPGLANAFSKEEILECVYEKTASTENPDKIYPQPLSQLDGNNLELPEFLPKIYPLDEVIDVDYYLPGCPPTVEWIEFAMNAIISGLLPERGSIIGPEKALCDECPRTRSEERKITKIFRPYEIIPDKETCLLEQGIICCGPSTRAGCKAACIEVNMPCRGCFGPPPNVKDRGAKMISAIASQMKSDNKDDLENLIDQIKDPLGTFYQFDLPKATLLKERKKK